MQSVGVIGAGAWGTALAAVARGAGRDVTLWALEPEVVEGVNTRHVNPLYLPDVPLDPGITATADMAVVAKSDIILLVPPAQHLRGVCASLAPHLAPGTPVVICAKGIERGSAALMSEVVAAALPKAVPMVLSGPTFAAEVASGKPAAVTLASRDHAVGEKVMAALGSPKFRPYLSSDLIGAEIGGAVKNVLAIGCGIVEGKGFGANARAALLTRGLAEIVGLAVALGGRPETLMGLSGLGDLVLTATSMQSRNYSLGVKLGKGESLDAVLGARRSVTEGVYTAAAVVALAAKHKCDMPICTAMDKILSGGAGIDDIIKRLMDRPLRDEFDDDLFKGAP